MRILFVAMSESVHTARWLSYLNDAGWELHLFPSLDNGINHPDLKDITVHHSLKGINLLSASVAGFCRRWLGRLFPKYRQKQLERLIYRLQPDIIHSMETQTAGYLVSDVCKNFQKKFHSWIHTIWGSDLFLFGKLDDHRSKIKELLASCNYFVCDSDRDECLSRELGFTGKVFRLPHVAGGINLGAMQSLHPRFSKASERKKIIVKGYQSWAGRALVALRALERCVGILKGYEICIYAPAPDVELAAKLFEKNNGVKVTVIRPGAPDETIYREFGASRIYIGLSISDGVPTSMLEAMAAGAFPIQSNTGNTDGWIQPDLNGILVPPEDPEIVEIAIRKAIADDDLVDDAQCVNLKIINEKLDPILVSKQVLNIYRSVLICTDVRD